MMNRFKPNTNKTTMTKTANNKTKRKPMTSKTTKPPMQMLANPTPTPTNETFQRAFGQFFPKFAESLLPPAETVDSVDALRLAADVCSVAAFMTERARNQLLGKPEPGFPTLTSEVARSLAAALHDWMSILYANLTPDARENLDAIEGMLDTAFKGRDGELFKFLQQIVTSDARATAHAVNFLVYISKWKPL